MSKSQIFFVVLYSVALTALTGWFVFAFVIDDAPLGEQAPGLAFVLVVYGIAAYFSVRMLRRATSDSSQQEKNDA